MHRGVVSDDEELLLLPQDNQPVHARRRGGCQMWLAAARWHLMSCTKGCLISLMLLCAALISYTQVSRIGNEQVHRLESEVQLQRTQLERLRTQLARAATPNTGPNRPCIDRWEVQYPAEIDVWNGHSCMWKQMWGQCGQFVRQCRRTCGDCAGAHSEEDDDSGPASKAEEDAELEADADAEETAESPSPPPASAKSTEQKPQQAVAQQPPMGEDSEALLQALLAREQAARPTLASMPAASTTAAKSSSSPKDSSSAGQRKDEGSTEEGEDDDDEDDDAEASSYDHAPSANVAGAHPATSGGIEAARLRYVMGDSNTVVSAGSECGVPTQAPAALKGLELGAFATKNFGVEARSYAAVTYLSNVIRVQPGEVHHYQQPLQLQRPAEGARGIASYVVEILEQVGSELRPAPEAALYLKGFALQQRPAAGRDAQSCASRPLLYAGEGARGVEVAFPHPFALETNEEAWDAELHIVRTEGLSAPLDEARQCVCMRSTIGSTRCCPHSCVYPAATEARAKPAQYRLSLVVTWLVGVGSEALRPIHAAWLPTGPEPVEAVAWTGERLGMACVPGRALQTEFDLPACSASRRPTCTYSSAGPWRGVDESSQLVLALGVSSVRANGLSLWTRAKQEQKERLLSRACGQDHTVQRIVPCVFATGELLSGGSALQVRTDWNTSQHVLGADAGFLLWVA